MWSGGNRVFEGLSLVASVKKGDAALAGLTPRLAEVRALLPNARHGHPAKERGSDESGLLDNGALPRKAVSHPLKRVCHRTPNLG